MGDVTGVAVLASGIVFGTIFVFNNRARVRLSSYLLAIATVNVLQILGIGVSLVNILIII